MKNVLIISAHADDEAFGMGGTMLRLSEEKNIQLYWLIATKNWYPKWSKASILSRKQAISKINEIIGFKEIIHWDYKDNRLDEISYNILQEELIKILERIKPEQIFTPSPWDFNFEHKIVYDVVEMSTKSYYSPYLKDIYAYETPSSTDASFQVKNNFVFNVYYNIENYIDKKLQLINYFKTELHSMPHPRSLEYIKALATVRGGEAGFKQAEGFYLLRGVK